MTNDVGGATAVLEAEARVEGRVRIAELAALRGPGMLSTIGLGSCVAIALWDAATSVGGLAHVLLPHPGAARDRSNDAKFASTAVPRLLREMRALGAGRGIEARLVGGATMFASLAGPGAQLGDRNVAAAREALAAEGVSVVGEAVGGDFGRSVYLHLDDGRLVVRSLVGGDVVL
jgi:chemotaxis protein CheD